MGIQDRDYYREYYANKNGMRYNTKSATYSNSEKLFSDSVRPRACIPKMHPVLIVLLTASICLVVFVLVKFISKLI